MTGDDWLWDKTGTPDAEVERLERVLSRYRHVPEPLAWPRERAWRWRLVAVAAALIAVLVPLALWLTRDRAAPADASPSYPVVGIPGCESVGVGEHLQTAAGESARIELGAIGTVEVGPESRVRVDEVAESAHHLYLERGRIHARVLAPPRLFQVGTPAGRSIDLGCAYVLEVDASGACTLDVTSGEVAWEAGGREVFVPRGAGLRADPVTGPSAPLYADAPQALRDALAMVGRPTKMGDEWIARELVEAARPEDSLTLFHVFDDPATSATIARACLDELLREFPPPAGVTAAGLASGDRAMRLAYRGALEPSWIR